MDFNDKSWVQKIHAKHNSPSYFFDKRLQTVALDLIQDALGPEYTDIWIEALAIVSGETADYLDDPQCSRKVKSKLSFLLDSYVPQLHNNVRKNDEVFKDAVYQQIVPSWEDL